MRSERRVARAVGVLYIVATAAGLLSSAALGSLLDGPYVLAHLDANHQRVLVAALFQFVMAVAVAGVAFMIHAVLARDAETPAGRSLAHWYVGTRVTEGALFLVGALSLLSLFELSQEVRAAGSSQPGQYQIAVNVLKSTSNYAFVLGQSVFCVGAVILYYLLFVSGRVPRWLSVWGLVGAPLMLAGGFAVAITGDANSTVSSLLYAPLGLQEMVLAVWLLVRGFSPPAVPSSAAGIEVTRQPVASRS